MPGRRNTTIWLKAGLGEIRNAYWASVIACGETSTGRPEMMMPKGRDMVRVKKSSFVVEKLQWQNGDRLSLIF